MREIRKKSTWEAVARFLKTFRQNQQILKSRVSSSEFLMKSRSRVSSLGFGIFDEASVSKF